AGTMRLASQWRNAPCRSLVANVAPRRLMFLRRFDRGLKAPATSGRRFATELPVWMGESITGPRGGKRRSATACVFAAIRPGLESPGYRRASLRDGASGL